VRQSLIQTLVGGGVSTTLVDYTVPAGRRAQLDIVDVEAVVTTVLGAAQTAIIEYQFDVGAGLANGATRFYPVASAVGTQPEIHGPGMYLTAGHRVVALCNVQAGTGSLTASGALKITEFDN